MKSNSFGLNCAIFVKFNKTHNFKFSTQFRSIQHTLQHETICILIVDLNLPLKIHSNNYLSSASYSLQRSTNFTL